MKFEYANTGASNSASAGWTEVVDCVVIGLPESDVNALETTNHSTSGNNRTFMAGLIDQGEGTFEAHYVQATFSTLKALEGTDKAFRMRMSNGSAVAWEGFISGSTASTDGGI